MGVLPPPLSVLMSLWSGSYLNAQDTPVSQPGSSLKAPAGQVCFSIR